MWKSTTGKAIIKLNDITDGEILYEGQTSRRLQRKELLNFNKKIQMIFQDPYASLNPRLKVMDIVAEGIDIHKLASIKDRKRRVYDLLETVGLSKNMRIVILTILWWTTSTYRNCSCVSVEPEFIIADEPISALMCLFKLK